MLDLKNPRIGRRHAQSQREAIDALIETKGEQLYALAKDICLHGLSINPIVVSDADERGKYVVLDGNRRVAALKLLKNPSVIEDPSYKRRFVSLATKYEDKIPDSIEVLYSDNYDSINEFIIRNHTGAGEGEGQLGWSALERAFFELDHGVRGQYDKAARLLRFAERLGINFTEEFPITTLQRLISERILNRIGIEIADNGEYKPKIDRETLKKRLNDLIHGLDTKRLHVKRDGTDGSLYSEEDREAYILDLINRFPDHNGRNSENNSLRYESDVEEETTNDIEPDGRKELAASTQEKTERSNVRSPAKPPYKRKKVIDRNHRIVFAKGKNEKAQAIYVELKSLQSAKHPIAIAFLIRALLELGVAHCLKTKGIEPPKKNNSLSNRIRLCCDRLESDGVIDKSTADAVLRFSSKDQFLSVDTLHMIVHNPHMPSNGEMVNQMWDAICPFIQACFNA